MTDIKPTPKLVKQYLDRQQMFDTPEQLLVFLQARIKQVGTSPSLIRHMLGSTYPEAVSMVRWYEKSVG